MIKMNVLDFIKHAYPDADLQRVNVCFVSNPGYVCDQTALNLHNLLGSSPAYWAAFNIPDEQDIKHDTKNPIYTGADKKDHIDDFADNNPSDSFRAAMNYNIQKYSKRYGKKDAHLKEAKKMADYCQRLVEFEESLLNE